MMKNKHIKVKAFTILELTIAMLVSAIVIAITYTSYSIISRSFLAFRQKNEETAMLSRIDQLLRRDIERADMVTGHDNEIRMDGTPAGTIIYELNAGHIIRRSSVIDTFMVSADHYHIFFEKRSPDEQNTGIQDQNENDRIDELVFIVRSKGDTISYHYSKRYSSENLIKRNPNAIN